MASRASFVEIHLVTAANAALLDRVDDDVFDHAVRPDLVDAFVANPSNLLAVAVEDGIVVGMATGIAYVHPDKPAQLFVNEIGVAARCRRRGLGARLIAALLRRGRELGCDEAWVATEEGNLAARALYASLGGREDRDRAVVFTFPLADEPAVTFRAAVSGDAAECVRVRGLTRENAVPAERLAAAGITVASWARDIETGKLPGHVAIAEGTIVGYAFGDTETGEVVVLALLPAFERRGLGRELLRRVVEELRSHGQRRLFLGCARDPATRSHGFYRHLGWRPTGAIDANGDEILELAND
jgi:ribosomal protein S18 acetylase RimI-like enzyme